MIPRRMLVALGVCFAACALQPHDSAGQATRVDITIAATTDVHGRVRGWDYYADTAETTRGLARVSTIFDSLRAAAPGRAIFVDAGDFLQGNALTYVASRPGFTGPHPVIAAMNALRYDAAVIGNHEFNYGIPFLDRATKEATFPFLAANVRRIDGKRGWAPAAFVDRGGIRVAIVGVTTPWAMVWDKLLLAKKLQIDDIVTSLRRAVKDARAAGAQVVVVVGHAGLDPPPGATEEELPGVGPENPMSTVAREVPGIDLIVLGHSHREVADTTINGVLMMQPRNWATGVAVATLSMERTGRIWKVAARRGAIVRAAGHAESKAVLDIAEPAHVAARKYVLTTVGRTAAQWRSDSSRTRDTPIIDFIGEVMRRATGADLASTAVFSTNIRIPAGPVTVAQLAQLYPYDNTIRVVKLSGDKLKAFLEQSARYFKVTGSGDAMHVAPDPAFISFNYEVVTGATYTIDLSRPVGDRITGLAVRGHAVTPSDSFSLALTNYRASGTGGYGMLVGVPLVKDDQREVRQLLIDEITKRRELSEADFFTESWHLVPAAMAAEAQAAIVRQPEFDAARRPPPAAAPAGSAPAGSAAPAQAGGRASVIRVISTNDFHGGLEPRTDGNAGRRGGAAQFAAVIRRLERECTGACTSVLVDGGDLFQGTPASNLAFGRPVIALYNALGYAATAIGNHDFDWGQDTLRARMRGAHFGMFAANVTDAEGRPVPWIRPDTIVERGGRRIGIIGLANAGTPNLTKPQNVSGLRFLRASAVVPERARQLRARGAEFIIVAAHSGSDCDSACGSELADLAQQSGGAVDAIIGGHSHIEFSRVTNGIPVMRARGSGRSVAVVDVPLDRASRAGLAPRNVFVATDAVAPEPDIARLVTEALAPLAALVATPVATIAADMRRGGSQYALGNFVADAQRAATGADVAAMNNGGVRADLQAGPATYDAFFQLSPFGNALVRLTVNGADLRVYLERLVSRREPNVHVSGTIVRYDPNSPAGSRIVNATVGGAPLDPARTYTITMNDFMSTGGDGLALARGASRVEDTGVNDLDALLDYVRTLPGGVVRPDAAPRLVAVPR
jgi:2',3'-cyclic-nucleotide 2'-phosphodiesterase/3'-nucleotidase/5'-nucleotidase